MCFLSLSVAADSQLLASPPSLPPPPPPPPPSPPSPRQEEKLAAKGNDRLGGCGVVAAFATVVVLVAVPNQTARSMQENGKRRSIVSNQALLVVEAFIPASVTYFLQESALGVCTVQQLSTQCVCVPDLRPRQHPAPVKTALHSSGILPTPRTEHATRNNGKHTTFSGKNVTVVG